MGLRLEAGVRTGGRGPALGGCWTSRCDLRGQQDRPVPASRSRLLSSWPRDGPCLGRCSIWLRLPPALTMQHWRVHPSSGWKPHSPHGRRETAGSEHAIAPASQRRVSPSLLPRLFPPPPPHRILPDITPSILIFFFSISSCLPVRAGGTGLRQQLSRSPESRRHESQATREDSRRGDGDESCPRGRTGGPKGHHGMELKGDAAQKWLQRHSQRPHTPLMALSNCKRNGDGTYLSGARGGVGGRWLVSVGGPLPLPFVGSIGCTSRCGLAACLQFLPSRFPRVCPPNRMPTEIAVAGDEFRRAAIADPLLFPTSITARRPRQHRR